MQLDNVLAEIIVEVQKRTKAKYDIDITFDQVVEMVNVQMTATVYGYARNITIYWKGFLKFIWTNRRERAKYKKDLFGTVLDKNNNLTPEEREYFHYLARVNAHVLFKELQTLAVNSKALTGEEVIALPTNTPAFRNFTLLVTKIKR